MPMMISVKRLSPILQSHHFDLVALSTTERSATFARPSYSAGLFEKISVVCQGGRGEAVVGHVETSVIRGRNATNGLAEVELLVEMADVQERVDQYGCWMPGYGQAIIETTERAREWERRFGEVAPKRAAILSRRKGPDLLASTAESRDAADELRQYVGDVSDLLTTLARLEGRASTQQRKLARRLAEWPGVLKIREAEVVYDIVTIALAVYHRQIASSKIDVDANPLHDETLMWLIQITVDRIVTGVVSGDIG